ncbi:chitinase [Mycobacterium kyorinense]|uniref:Chitinase n=1 Tax=Mycobacterium kyorinense TaxID=487514 RepID=A0A1A2ZLJ4_9MYCO|nr:chitinase [Mycobacterium kyorinense]
MTRFQFAGVTTKCVPDWVTVLFHACEMDCPAGMSNSSLQSLSGAMLALVIAKRAMKPVCHVCSTDNFAVTAAA